VKIFIIATMVVAAASGCVYAQSTRSLINEGNDLYEEKQYEEAEINYRKALNEDQGSVAGTFNLGNALNKQGKFDQSASEFEAAALKAEEKGIRGNAHFNRGNSFLEASEYDQAIASYTEALKLDPSDQDAKYNLSYALMKRRQQQQGQQQGGGKDDQNKDQQQDKKNKDQKQDKQQNKNDQQQQENQKQDNQQQKQDQQQSQQQKTMSRADAERILEVLKSEEKEVQKKLRAKVQTRAKTDKDW